MKAVSTVNAVHDSGETSEASDGSMHGIPLKLRWNPLNYIPNDNFLLITAFTGITAVTDSIYNFLLITALNGITAVTDSKQ